MGLENLRIFIKTKARVSAHKMRKLQVLQSDFFQLLHSDRSSVHVKGTCNSFLRHTQKLKTDCYTTVFEEERRKAEEDDANVSGEI